MITRTDDLNSFNEAIALTKGWQDQVWQASALEGLSIALVIQGWSPRSTRFDASVFFILLTLWLTLASRLDLVHFHHL